MCIYGIELLADNIAESRANLLAVFVEFFDLSDTVELYPAATVVNTRFAGSASLVAFA